MGKPGRLVCANYLQQQCLVTFLQKGVGIVLLSCCRCHGCVLPPRPLFAAFVAGRAGMRDVCTMNDERSRL